MREQVQCTLALVGDESSDVDEADDIRRIARFGDYHPGIAVADQKGRARLQTSTLLVAATSSASDVSGSCTTLTV